jgi:xanthine/CO dehydrogenase XdhC/CoxF family maturation factor
MWRGMQDALSSAAAWHARGLSVALATVIETWGSSPCPVGAQMAVASDGSIAGSVSGGCVESDVLEQAQAVLAGGRPQVLDYGVSDETAWSAGLACGGRLKVLLERIG